MDYPLFDFVLASLIMGLGIGTDVAIATVLRANQLDSRKAALFWVLGVSLTHTLFPMVGYMLTYFSIQWSPAITPIVGLLAFYCIARYLYLELAEYASPSQSSGDERRLIVTLGLVLAVSWDALWSGPAKSAQVIGWPELLVWLSFVVVGMLVAGFALLGLRFAQRFTQERRRFGISYYMGLWVQYSVIGYFGLLALLRYSLGLNIHWYQILLMCAALMAVLMEGLRIREKLVNA